MSASGSRATVVVANADATVCEVLARVVESAGLDAIRVTDADGAADAVATADAAGAVLDLDAATVPTLRALREHPSGAAVRVVAIAAGPAAALLAWQADADAVLVRPFEAAALGGALTEALARDDAARAAARAAAIAAAS